MEAVTLGKFKKMPMKKAGLYKMFAPSLSLRSL